MTNLYLKVFQVSVVLVILSTPITAIVKRCWTCRSRGEFGDCRDPFVVNPTNLERFPGANAAPCASGWCGKIVEGDEVEYSIATERLCLPRPPDDNQERCAETHYKHRKVYMCFCMGDLCNTADLPTSSLIILLVGLLVHFVFLWNTEKLPDVIIALYTPGFLSTVQSFPHYPFIQIITSSFHVWIILWKHATDLALFLKCNHDAVNILMLNVKSSSLFVPCPPENDTTRYTYTWHIVNISRSTLQNEPLFLEPNSIDGPHSCHWVPCKHQWYPSSPKMLTIISAIQVNIKITPTASTCHNYWPSSIPISRSDKKLKNTLLTYINDSGTTLFLLQYPVNFQ